MTEAVRLQPGDAAPDFSLPTDTGAQLDVRLTMLSELELTLSIGGAVAFEKDQPIRREAMISLKILK